MFILVYVGALTLKPYQFSFRSWEVEVDYGYDIFDSFGSLLCIEIFNLNIIRILPKLDNKNVFNYITDRIRFYFDGLCNGFIEGCFIRRKNNLFCVSWYCIYKYFQYFNCLSFRRFYNVVNYFYESGLDIFMFQNLRVFFFLFFFKFFRSCFFFFFNYFNFDFLNNFFFKTLNSWIENYQYIVIYMYNIRCEHPLLFVYIRFLVKKKCFVFFFGISYFIKNFKLLGISLKDLIFFFYNKNFYYKKKKLNCLFLSGSGLLIRYDFFYYNCFLVKLQQIFIKYLVIIDIKYSIFNIFDLNCLYFGLVDSFMDKIINLKNIYYYNIYNIYYNIIYIYNKKNLYMLNIYLNNIKLSNENKYDILLSINNLYENESYNINIFAKKCYNLYIYKLNINNKYINDINIYMFIKNVKNFFFKTYICKYMYLLKYINIYEIFYFYCIYYNKKKKFEFYYCKYKYQSSIIKILFNNIKFIIKLNNLNMYIYLLNNYYISFINTVKSLNLLLAYNINFNKNNYKYYLVI